MSTQEGKNYASVNAEEIMSLLAQKVYAEAQAARNQKRLEQQRAAEESPYKRMTFMVRKEYIQNIRDYAYTFRMDNQEVLDLALRKFFETVDLEKLDKAPESRRGRRTLSAKE